MSTRGVVEGDDVVSGTTINLPRTLGMDLSPGELHLERLRDEDKRETEEASLQDGSSERLSRETYAAAIDLYSRRLYDQGLEIVALKKQNQTLQDKVDDNYSANSKNLDIIRDELDKVYYFQTYGEGRDGVLMCPQTKAALSPFDEVIIVEASCRCPCIVSVCNATKDLYRQFTFGDREARCVVCGHGDITSMRFCMCTVAERERIWSVLQDRTGCLDRTTVPFLRNDILKKRRRDDIEILMAPTRKALQQIPGFFQTQELQQSASVETPDAASIHTGYRASEDESESPENSPRRTSIREDDDYSDSSEDIGHSGRPLDDDSEEGNRPNDSDDE
jgi:hypothetical protein